MSKSIRFTGPKLVHDVDVARFERACPVDSVTQGVYFQYLRDAIEAQCGKSDHLFAGLEQRDWTAFRRYPLRDFMRLAVNAARIAHPKEALSEGLRQLGRLAYPSFAATMAGRVVIFAFGERLENMINALPKAYAISVPGVSVEVLERGPAEYSITMKNVYNFVDTYHLGVLEGCVLAMGFQPHLSVQVGERLCDAEFVGHWTAE